jgi:dynamin 1-like protein
MDEGTNALEIIRGKVYPLKLGYVPVVCRSQKDIMEGRPIRDALRQEDLYFKSNEDYQAMSSRCGIPYLCRALNEIIVKHIKQCLPVLRSKITSCLYQKEKELKTIMVHKGAANQQ